MTGLDIVGIDLKLWFGDHISLAREKDISIGLIGLYMLSIGKDLEFTFERCFGCIVQNELDELERISLAHIVQYARGEVILLVGMQEGETIDLGAAVGCIVLNCDGGLLRIIVLLRIGESNHMQKQMDFPLLERL